MIGGSFEIDDLTSSDVRARLDCSIADRRSPDRQSDHQFQISDYQCHRQLLNTLSNRLIGS